MIFAPNKGEWLESEDRVLKRAASQVKSTPSSTSLGLRVTLPGGSLSITSLRQISSPWPAVIPDFPTAQLCVLILA